MSWFRTGSAVGLLRVLLVASVAVPGLLLGLDAWFGYDAASWEAARNAARTCEVVREHAAKVFNSHELVAGRIDDLLRDLDDETVRASEWRLRETLLGLIEGLPQVGSFVVLDRRGRLLVAAGAYPAPRSTDFSDREYFAALQFGPDRTFISRSMTSRVSGKRVFGLGRRLRAPDGSFRGVVDIAISPQFFTRFWETLVGEEDVTEGSAVALVREDGAILAHWPSPEDVPEDAVPSFLQATLRAQGSGSFASGSLVGGGAETWQYTFRKVQGYPVYAVLGRSRSGIRAIWARRMATHLTFGVPATAALWWLTWTALQRTRREEAALRRMAAEMQRREAAEATLMQAQRLEAVGQLTGGVAHDFNNLLTIMLGNFEMIGRAPEWHDRVARLSRAGMAAAQRGAELTAKLLAFSRRRMVRPEVLDLNRLLREFSPVLRQGVNEAIELVLELEPELHPAALDPGQLEAAVLNLVGNARDAMPAGGMIRVTTRNERLTAAELADLPGLSPGAYVRVAVSDNGAGMEPGVAAQAFEPFFTTKDVGRGTGLGLTQVYGFCKQAGGGVRIRSAPGRGTTVEMLLPCASEPVRERQAPSDDVRPASADGRLVLVVEDDEAVLEVAVASLQDLGYATLTATHAAQALDILRAREDVDILFSDVVIPGGMNGVQLSAAACRLRPCLRILLASGYPGNDWASPADAVVLAKPYTRGDLAAALA